MTPDTEEWEKEFDEKFVKTIPVTKERLVQDTERRLKNFIRSLIAEREAERDTYWKERVRKEVEGMRKTKTFPQHLNGWDGKTTYFERLSDGDIHFNQALDTLLDNLK